MYWLNQENSKKNKKENLNARVLRETFWAIYLHQSRKQRTKTPKQVTKGDCVVVLSFMVYVLSNYRKKMGSMVPKSCFCRA